MILAPVEMKLAGSTPTEHELKILRLYAESGSTKAVATKLQLSNQTVKNTLWKVRLRLAVGTTIEAAWQLRRELESVAL